MVFLIPSKKGGAAGAAVRGGATRSGIASKLSGFGKSAGDVYKNKVKPKVTAAGKKAKDWWGRRKAAGQAEAQSYGISPQQQKQAAQAFQQGSPQAQQVYGAGYQGYDEISQMKAKMKSRPRTIFYLMLVFGLFISGIFSMSFIGIFGLIISVIFIFIAVFSWVLPSRPQFAIKVHEKFSKYGFVMVFVFLIIIMIVAGYLLVATPLGHYVTSKFGGGKAGTLDVLSQAESPLNTIKMIFKGEYDPSQIWTSKTYEDKYAVEASKKIGVYLTDAKALRPQFWGGDPIKIIGMLNIDGLPTNDFTDVSVFLDAEFSITEYGATLGGDWTCTPQISILPKGGVISRKQFECDYPMGIPVDEGDYQSYSVDLITRYNFETLAGKQIAVAPASEIDNFYSSGRDPVDALGLTKSQLAAWQTKDPNVELGLGLSGNDVVSASSERFTNYLGFTIRNVKDGDIVELTNFSIILPCSIDVDPELCTQGSATKECDFVPQTCNTASDCCVTSDHCDCSNTAAEDACKGAGGTELICRSGMCITPSEPLLCEYKLRQDSEADRSYVYIGDSNPIEPAGYRTYYLMFSVDQNKFLGNQPSSSFFVLSDLYYKYKDVERVSISVQGTQAAASGQV